MQTKWPDQKSYSASLPPSARRFYGEASDCWRGRESVGSSGAGIFFGGVPVGVSTVMMMVMVVRGT